MIVLDIRGRNFLSYPSFGINLQHRGVVLVLGANGSGKSAIVTEPLAWCLFGRTVRGLTGDAVIHDPDKTGKEKDCEVTTRIGTETCTYEVTRFRKVKRRNGLRFVRVNSLGVREDLTGGTMKATQATIEQTLGISWETFLVTTIFGQGQIDRFSGATDATRKEILDDMLGMRTWREAREVVRDQRRENLAQEQRAHNAADTAVAVLNHNSAEKVRARERSSEWHREHTEQLRSLQQHRQRLVSQRQENEERRTPVENLQALRDTLSARAEAAKEKLQDQWDNAQSAVAEAAAAAEIVTAQVADSNEEYHAAANALTEANTLHGAAEKEHARALAAAKRALRTSVDEAKRHHDDLVTKRAEAGEAHKKAQEAHKRHVLHRAELRKSRVREWQTELRLLKQEDANLQHHIDRLIGEIESLQSEQASHNVCGSCGVDLVDATAKGMVDSKHLQKLQDARAAAVANAEAQAEVALESQAKNAEKIARVADTLDGLKRGHDLALHGEKQQQLSYDNALLSREVERTLAAVTDLAIAVTQAAEAQAAAEATFEEPTDDDVENDVDVAAARDAICNTINRYHVRDAARTRAWNRLEEAKASHDEVNEYLTAARDAAREVAQELAAFGKVNPSAVQLALVDSQIIGAQKAEAAYREAQTKLDAEIAKADARIGAHGEKRNEHEDQLDRLTRSETKLTADVKVANDEVAECLKAQEVLDALDHAFGPAGVRSHLLDQVTPELNDAAQRYASALSGGRLRVAFDTETQLASGEQRDRFDMVVELEPGASSYTACSGGWRKRADLAQLLAFRSARQARHSGLDLLVLDEPMTNVDNVGTEQAVALITELSQNLGTVLLCTHDEALQAYFSQRVHVSIDSRGRSRAEGDLV